MAVLNQKDVLDEEDMELEQYGNNDSIQEQAQTILIDEEEIKQLHILQKIYRFLQLLCEGHNKDLQNYLRDQKCGG